MKSIKIKMISEFIISVLIICILANCHNVSASIPDASASESPKLDVEGHDLDFDPDLSGFQIDSFFDVVWTDPSDGEDPSENVNITVSDGIKNETVGMDQNGNTVLSMSDDLLTYGLVDNATQIHIPTGLEGIDFISDASTNIHYIYMEDFADLITDMNVGSWLYNYWDGASMQAILMMLDTFDSVPCLHIVDSIEATSILMLQNNTIIINGIFYSGFGANVDPIGYTLTFNNNDMNIVGNFFDITIQTETGIAMITLFANTGAINPIFSVIIKNIWQWEFGIVDVTLYTMFGEFIITYFALWFWYYYGLMYVFIYDVWNIKIECFWYDYFYVVWNWWYITIVWYYWDAIWFWEWKIVWYEWIIDITINFNTIWIWWFNIYYITWILPVIVFQVPILYIPPIVDIDIYSETYDATADELNLTYSLTDIYGNPVLGADVDISVDGAIKNATELGNGLYFASFIQSNQSDAWDIYVNATVPQVALVDDLPYTLDIDEVTAIQCPDCPQISTMSWIIIGSVGGGAIAIISIIGVLFARKSKALNMCLNP